MHNTLNDGLAVFRNTSPALYASQAVSSQCFVDSPSEVQGLKLPGAKVPQRLDLPPPPPSPPVVETTDDRSLNPDPKPEALAKTGEGERKGKEK